MARTTYKPTGRSVEQKKISTGYKPRKLQKVLHETLRRFNVLVCHRRFGKTVCCVNEIIDKALRNPLRNPQYFYIAPTYRQAKRIAWDYFVDYTRYIPGVKKNKTELTIFIERPWHVNPVTGESDPDTIKIILAGADDPDSIRGIYADGAILDEFAQCDPIIWGQIIRHALADRKKEAIQAGHPEIEPWAVFIGTPKGQNHFHRRYEQAKAYQKYCAEYEECHDIPQERREWKDLERKYGIDLDTSEDEMKEIRKKWSPLLREAYAAWTRYKISSNWHTALYKASETGVLDLEELDEMKQDLSKEEIEQELECSFTAAVLGAYFGVHLTKATDDARIGKFPYDPRFPVDTHWDLGVGDKCTIWFSQKIHGRVVYIDYFEHNGEGVGFYKKMLDAKALRVGIRTEIEAGIFVNGRGLKYGRHCWPHDGKVVEFGTGQSRQETARLLGLTITILPKQRIEDRIQAGRNRFAISCFDAEHCVRGLECLYNFQKEWDDKLMMFKNKPKHDWSSHGSDSFTYSALDDRPSFFPDDWKRKQDQQTTTDSDYDELAA